MQNVMNNWVIGYIQSTTTPLNIVKLLICFSIKILKELQLQYA